MEPLLKYCELQGYRTASHDDYGWARMCQVMGNFFGGSTSLGIGPYTTGRQMDPGDNGIYVIDDWLISEHLRTEYDEDWNAVGMRAFESAEEHDWHKFDDMLRSLDASMPEELRLGGPSACGVTSRPASPSTLYSRRAERSESHAMTSHKTGSDTPSPCRRLAEWGAGGSQGRAQRHSPTDP